jgi:hypothetical protein
MRRPDRRWPVAQLHPPGAHWLSDVFQPLGPHIVERSIDLSPNLALGVIGDADAARVGDTLQTSRNVYAVAENIVVLENDIAKMDANTELNSLVPRYGPIVLEHGALYLNGASHRSHRTSKFDQQSVACGFDDPPAMLSDDRVDDSFSDRLKPT